MATTIQLIVTGKVTGRNGRAIPGVTVKAFWNGTTSQAIGPLGVATADAWGRYKLIYRYQSEKKMRTFSDTAPIRLQIEAGDSQVKVGQVAFNQTTVEAMQDIVLNYEQATNVLSKEQLPIARSMAAMTREKFQGMTLSPQQKDVVMYVQKLAGLKQDGSRGEETYYALQNAIFHTNLVFDKKKTSKLYAMIRELGYAVPAEVAAMNLINSSTVALINDAKGRRRIPSSSLIDECGWMLLEEELLEKRMRGGKTKAEIQQMIRRAASFILKDEPAAGTKSVTKSEGGKSRKQLTAGRETISRLQKKLGLGVTGNLDLQTYRKIESVSMSHGRGRKYLSVPDSQKLALPKRTLSLNVKDQEQVQLLQKALAYLGHKIDVEEFKTGSFGKTTLEAVKGFQKGNKLRGSGKFDHDTREAMGDLLGQTIVESPEVRHCIVGFVSDSSFAPVKNAAVTVYTIGSDGSLTQACIRDTSKDGYYHCEFVAPVNPETKEKQAVFNVMVTVSPFWNPDVLVTCKHILVTSLKTTVNFNGISFSGGADSDGNYYGESDFAFVERKLISVLRKNYGSFLSHCSQTVSNVARQAELLEERVLYFVLAHRMHEQLSQYQSYLNDLLSGTSAVITLGKVTPEVYYGLLNKGVFGTIDKTLFICEMTPITMGQTTNLTFITTVFDVPEYIWHLADALVATPDNTLGSVLDYAVEGALVSYEVKLSKGNIVNELSTLKRCRALTRKQEENRYTLDELLRILSKDQILKPSQYLTAATAFLQSSCQFGEAFYGRFKSTMHLSDSHDRWMRALFLTSLTVRGALSPLEKAYRDIRPHFPGRIVMISPEDWRTKYGASASQIADIGNQMLVHWPREFFIYNLNGFLSTASTQVKDAVSVLLECMFEDDADKRFDLYSTTQPDEYSYTASNGKVFDRDSVRIVQRVRRITADFRVAAALLNKNLTSASTIFFRGKSALRSVLEEMGVPNTDAATKETFNRVEYIYAQVLSQYLNLRDSVNKSGTEGKASPELRNLFGTLDSYAVEEEMTLLGPPAYLADLLRFLGQMPAEKRKTALDILLSRRPDIGEIKLNTANANDPVPYIDLVCYTLEKYVLDKMGVAVERKDDDTVANYRTKVSNEVYSRLQSIGVPGLRPYFSLPQTMNRAYFDFLGAPRYRLMELMDAGPEEVAGEYFGMSLNERRVFVKYYEKASKTLLEPKFGKGVLVTDLMKKLEMTYSELMELLAFIDFTFVSSSISDYADITLQAVTNKRSASNDRTVEECLLLRRLQRMSGLPLKEFLKLMGHPLIGDNRYQHGGNVSDLLVETYSFLRIKDSLSLSFAETLELFGGECRIGEKKQVSETALARYVPDFEAIRMLFPEPVYPLDKASSVRSFLRKAKAVQDSEFSAKDLKYLTGSGVEDESYSLLAEETLTGYAKQVQEIMTRPDYSDSGVSDLHVLLSGWLGLGEDKLFYLTDRKEVVEGLKGDPVRWCRHLHRIALCDQRLALTSTQFKVLTDHSQELGTPDFFAPDFSGWSADQLLAMSRLVALDYEFQPEDSGKGFMEVLCSATTRTLLLKRLSELSGKNMAGLMPNQKFSFFRTPACYEILSEVTEYLVKLRCTALDLYQWTMPGNYSEEEKLATTLRANISARYSEAKAAEWLRQTENPVREKKRDVLVNWLLEKDGSFENTAGMTAYFLMDVEMNAEQDTSEIRHALSSVQMFVQRCLLNLETGITVSAQAKSDDSSANSWSQWNWMKNYRVWEANRKIFLFPENFMEPELRDGMSPFFQELLVELQQNEATQENVEDALLNYLHKLDEVAHLEVCGIYREQEDLNKSVDGYEQDIWHVVARTKSSPHAYYYRTYDVNYHNWSPWERIEVELDGDQIVPVVYNRRLYIFWLQFTVKDLKPEKLPAAEATTGHTEVQETLQYYEIQLLWTQRKGGSWLAKRTSMQKLIHPWLRPTRSFTLKPYLDTNTNDLVMDIYVSTSEEFNTGTQNLHYDLYSGSSALYTGTSYDQSYNPWLSSAFVFNGDVKKVLFKNVGKSLNYVKKTFGADAAAMEDFGYASGARLELPGGMHLEGNWLKNNLVHDINGSYLNVPEYSDLSGELVTKTLASGAKSPFQFLISLQNQQLNAAWKDALMFYRDNERIFSVHNLGPKEGEETYGFETFYHPFVDDFVRQLNKEGIDGLYKRGLQEKPWDYSPVRHSETFYKTYSLTSRVSGKPKEMVDFSNGGAYAVYNWELFFHIPLTIACKLMQNQKFEEAMNWFHYIFNPIDYANGAGDCPERYWVTLPFRENAREQVTITYKEAGQDKPDNYRIEGILENLTKNADQVRAWRNNPFKPHIIAQFRTAAYQHQVVIKYINNLISWADMLFREDTMESINEATMLYMLAGEILGPRPNKVVNPLSRAGDHSFNELKDGLDSFGNAKTDANLPLYIENNLLVNDNSVLASHRGSELQKLDIAYFSTPSNDAMLACWDAVGDRLYKIRNSLNIDGVFRKLALYEPPIDPAMLVRAAAAGVSLKDALSGGGSAPRVYRFRTVIQKAAEFCQDVKALGEKLLSALEKKDSEALAQLRQSQELIVLNAATAVKKQQIEEAKESIKQLNASKDGAVIRQNFFENIEYMSDKEIEALSLSMDAFSGEESAAKSKVAASAVTVIPSITSGVSGFGGTPVFDMRVFDGGMVANAMNLIAQSQEIQSALKSHKAGLISTKASYERRAADWKLQAQTAAKEVEALERQIVCAEIRLSMAELDLKNHQTQIENNKAMTEAMNNRFATEKLYNWMANQVIGIYFKSYQMAYDLALSAQECFDFELGETGTQIIKSSHWNSLYKGLMAGDTLMVNIRELEKAYLERNTRSLELTKSISLAELAPNALMQLIGSGSCSVSIPDKVFNMDYPSHYMRRIKNVSISIPCIAGPHTSVNCSLTLNKSKYCLKDGSLREFSGLTPSIATSSALNDSGMFEVNFNDERYLPFEGMGVDSEWTLSLPLETNYFDRTSISDIILNISYTARRKETVTTDNSPVPYGRLFNLKSEFPDEWYRFKHPAEDRPQSFVFEAEAGNDRFARYLWKSRNDLKVVSVWGKTGETVKELNDAEAQYSQGRLRVCFRGSVAPAYDNLYVVLKP